MYFYFLIFTYQIRKPDLRDLRLPSGNPVHQSTFVNRAREDGGIKIKFERA